MKQDKSEYILALVNTIKQLLQIRKWRKLSPRKQKTAVTKPKKETILMKAQKLKVLRDDILTGKTKHNVVKNKNKVKQGKSRKQRQTLEEKQMSKLRSLRFEEDKSETIQSSKIEYLKYFNIVPNIIYL